MARRQGQIISAELKVKIVLETLEGEQTINQIASKYNITTKSILNWKKQFLDNASLVFDTSSATKSYKSEIEDLKQQNDNLAKALGKATIRADWAEGKLRSLDYKTKKSLIGHKLNISIEDQCKILNVSRGSFYYKSKQISQYNLQILNAMDEIYTNNSEYGYRFIHQQLM